MTRARDRLGRPLPPDSAPDPDLPAVPDLADAADAQVWATALALIGDGLPFHAHEVFEDRWRLRVAEASPDVPAWRALAQWGAALTHEARGNPVGARRLAERALATLESAVHVPVGVDVTLVRASCAALISPRC